MWWESELLGYQHPCPVWGRSRVRGRQRNRLPTEVSSLSKLCHHCPQERELSITRDLISLANQRSNKIKYKKLYHSRINRSTGVYGSEARKRAGTETSVRARATWKVVLCAQSDHGQNHRASQRTNCRHRQMRLLSKRVIPLGGTMQTSGRVSLFCAFVCFAGNCSASAPE